MKIKATTKTLGNTPDIVQLMVESRKTTQPCFHSMVIIFEFFI
jgi:hypothetical protein